MSDESNWAVWVWKGNGRRVRPVHIATDDPTAGHLVFATRLPAGAATTSREVLQGLLHARQRPDDAVGDVWENAVEGWRTPYQLDWPWPNDAVIVIDPAGRGSIFRLRRNGKWSRRPVRERVLPDAALLPHDFVGCAVYAQLVRGGTIVSA